MTEARITTWEEREPALFLARREDDRDRRQGERRREERRADDRRRDPGGFIPPVP